MKRKLALLALGALVLATVPVTGALGQTGTFTVEFGFEVPRGFSNRVLAPIDHGTPTLNVTTNDVVDLFGGAVVLPEGTTPMEWHSDNTQELDAPFGLVLSDPDADLEGVNADYKFNIMAIDTPTDPDCGATADDACVIDGTTLFNGGNRFDGPAEGHFFVRIAAPPGTTLWATSLFGVSRLSALKINVVATGVDTQAEIDAAATKLRALETDAARALDAKLRTRSTKHRTASGQVVHDAWAGYDTATFALFDFYPARLVVKKGEKVRWHFSNLHIEQHGLAFPLKSALDISNNEGFIPSCDPDGDEGEGPDVLPNFETFSCDDPAAELEFDSGRRFTAEIGDGRFPGGSKKFEGSGLRGANIPSAPGLAGGLDPWDLTFTKASADKGYKYICTFHGRFMNATVVVK
ncbi:MAG: hypothetical protein M3277_01590 [Actinomycetota bacterium]|nr:hypothetical protein [Actinomycetota bacterium]